MNSPITRQVAKTNAIEIENDSHIVLISYATPVAFLFKGNDTLKPFANVTDVKWSNTTSRHIADALRRWGVTETVRVPQQKIDKLAANIN